MFIEACFRMAKLIYASNAKYDNYDDDENDYSAQRYRVTMT